MSYKLFFTNENIQQHCFVEEILEMRVSKYSAFCQYEKIPRFLQHGDEDREGDSGVSDRRQISYTSPAVLIRIHASIECISRSREWAVAAILFCFFLSIFNN